MHIIIVAVARNTSAQYVAIKEIALSTAPPDGGGGLEDKAMGILMFPPFDHR
jgi:hypothetical protein